MTLRPVSTPDALQAKRGELLQRLMRQRVAAAGAPMIPRAAPDASVVPTTLVQQGIWFLEALSPVPSLHSMTLSLRLIGRLDVEALTTAMNAIVARHEILRTTFSAPEGHPIQSVASTRTLVPCRANLRSRDASAREREALALVTAEVERPFDLATGPLLRMMVVEMADDEHLLIVICHHMVFDGWSGGVLLTELSALYDAIRHGRAPTLPELRIQYADYALWQQERLRSAAHQEQLEYWMRQLHQAPSDLLLPTDRPRPAQQSFCGASRSFEIDKNLVEDLLVLSRREGVTLFVTVFAAFTVLLQRYTQQDDLLVGTPVANRHPETEPLIGCFINTVVLRADLSNDPPFLGLLRRLRTVCLEAYANQELPFERVVEALHPQRDLSRLPFIQILFQLQTIIGSHQEVKLPGLEATGFTVPRSGVQGDLMLDLMHSTQGLRGTFVYRTDLFDAPTIARMEGQLQMLLRGVVAAPDRRLSQLPLLTPEEQKRVLIEWNATETETPRQCVHELFERQAARTPDAVAVEFEGETLTYQQLNGRANLLAHRLIRAGVGPDILVGLLLERSFDLLIGLLGILKAGGAYMPLDPAYPPDRLRTMLQDSQPHLMVTCTALRDRPGAWEGRVLCLDAEPFDVKTAFHTPARHSVGMKPVHLPAPLRRGAGGEVNFASGGALDAMNPAHRAAPEHLAYAIYTSGSTGRPKGVMIEHRALTNLLWAMRDRPGVTRDDVLLAVTTLSFDIAALELLLPLIVGARLIVATRSLAVDGPLLAQTIARKSVTILQATPATWRLLLEAGWPESSQPVSSRRKADQQGTKALKSSEKGARRFKILCGGEALPVELAGRLLQSGATLWNLYGPTETTIWSTARQIEAGEDPISIGRPIANTQAYILDRFLQPTPSGVTGDLYLGGAGLARGYLGRPDLTAERLVPHPFSVQPGARLYRTGDQARFRADGRIEFLGRRDDQVKVRGYRIELGEIETVLSRHPDVQQSVVTVRSASQGDQRLAAYVVATVGSEVTAETLRSHLREQLPTYMIPSDFVFLDRLPLTSNGKVDRKELPEPDGLRLKCDVGYVAPHSSEEKLLARLWSEVLGLEQVGIHDDFFDLGGHSLLAVQLFTRMERAFGKKLPLALLFQATTIAQLIPRLRNEQTASLWSSLVPIQSNGTHPPFFCVHAFGANLLNYRLLAKHLGGDQPLYGFQSRGLDGLQAPHTSVEAMAAQYVAEMRTIQPKGPYLLGGGSSGGLIAYEMARQLHAAGETIAALILIDTYCPLPTSSNRDNPRTKRVLAGIDRHLGHLMLQGRQEARRYVQSWVREKVGRRRVIDGPSPLEDSTSGLPSDIQQVIQANMLALQSYELRPYAGRITQLLTRQASYRTATDPRLAWTALAGAGLEIHSIEGDHTTMLEEPHVAVTAATLRSCLRRVTTHSCMITG
jgi:amino acid adenylation domain-containing protein